MTNKNKSPISVAIITKNEELRLPDCLKSVSFSDDIVVVDSGSTDRTVEIARAFGCKVYVEDWKGDGPQKNSAIAKCRYEWVLILDADERILPETGKAILKAIQEPTADAFSFPRKNYLHGRWIRHSDWWPERIIRLVRKGTGSFHSITHSRWVTNGSLYNLACPIEHFSFTGYSDMLKRLNDYSENIARELYTAGKRTHPTIPVLHGLGMFIKIYIVKKGFLDGFDGLVIALTKAMGSFFKYAKLLEIQRKSK